LIDVVISRWEIKQRSQEEVSVTEDRTGHEVKEDEEEADV
jgi:hypothetical protein